MHKFKQIGNTSKCYRIIKLILLVRHQYCIALFATAKTIVSGINFHAGMLVSMEWTTAHTDDEEHITDKYIDSIKKLWNQVQCTENDVANNNDISTNNSDKLTSVDMAQVIAWSKKLDINFSKLTPEETRELTLIHALLQIIIFSVIEFVTRIKSVHLLSQFILSTDCLSKSGPTDFSFFFQLFCICFGSHLIFKSIFKLRVIDELNIIPAVTVFLNIYPIPPVVIAHQLRSPFAKVYLSTVVPRISLRSVSSKCKYRT